jgi:hypothetical protein
MLLKWVLLVRDEHCPKALGSCSGLAVGEVDLQFVDALKIEYERAFRTADLPRGRVLATVTEARAFDQADGA